MSEVRRVPRGYATAQERAPRGIRGGQYVAVPPDEDVVVFVIGMRINRLRRIRSWWPAFVGMPRMLKELQSQPDSGLLDARLLFGGRTFLVLQYWRSPEQLGAYARDSAKSHAPAWAAFNKAAAPTGDVGIFHETYVVPADRIESLYGNMPSFGLGAALGSVPRGERVKSRNTAHDRMATTEPEYDEAS